MTESLNFFDRQLRFSAILPDFQDRLDWMERESAKIGGWTRHQYGPGERQRLEIRGAPEDGGLLPVFFHGGYWRALDMETHRFTAAGLTALGPGQVNVEYRLMPGARLFDLVEDAAQALAFAARAWPGTRLVVLGHSAGAHLAHWAIECAGLNQSQIAGMVAISGIYDLSPISKSFLQSELSLTADEIADLSPLHATSQTGLRRLIVVGECETGLYHAQAGRFAEKTGAGLAVVDGAHHMSVLAGLATPAAGLARAVAAFANGGDVPALIEGETG